ncbi:hypothetical protein [Streptococcus sp. HMSC071H03]|uniref:hypothetical protein n=1 Tax=Streptococcus sp. HMSC071H03 TaxID=1739391 RepID=UPI00164BFDD7|nr:hypothetical protein [Streptococcus sp. HMSC071H03]
MKTVTLEEVIEAFEKQFYSLGEMQKQKLLNYPDAHAVLSRLAFLMDCARC